MMSYILHNKAHHQTSTTAVTVSSYEPSVYCTIPSAAPESGHWTMNQDSRSHAATLKLDFREDTKPENIPCYIAAENGNSKQTSCYTPSQDDSGKDFAAEVFVTRDLLDRSEEEEHEDRKDAREIQYNESGSEGTQERSPFRIE